VPTGAALFANDYVFPHIHPRELAERLYNIKRWNVIPTGGHFAAAEEPLALAEEIRAFFRPRRGG